MHHQLQNPLVFDCVRPTPFFATRCCDGAPCATRWCMGSADAVGLGAACHDRNHASRCLKKVPRKKGSATYSFSFSSFSFSSLRLRHLRMLSRFIRLAIVSASWEAAAAHATAEDSSSIIAADVVAPLMLKFSSRIPFLGGNVPKPKKKVRLDALRMPPFTRARSGSVGSDDGRLTEVVFFSRLLKMKSLWQQIYYLFHLKRYWWVLNRPW